MSLLRLRKRKPRAYGRPGAVRPSLLVAALLLTLSTGAAAAEMSDADVQAAVENQYVYDPVVDLNDVDVIVADGILTLTGETSSLLEKERAVRIARAVKGVRGVVDRLEIGLGALRSDAAILEDVRSALLTDPATESYELDVAVEDGVVRLRGAVDSWREHALAKKIAKAVDGVLDVEDAMTVSLIEDRSDAVILTEVEAALDWDVRIDDTHLQVAVENGTVRLSGVVGSAAEKERVEAKAWVLGVQDVDAGGLEVHDWAASDELRSAAHVDRTDGQIEKAIRHALAVDPRVLSFEIRPRVEAGFVTLRGKVDNLKAKRSAAADARNVTGVVAVLNRIKVRPPEASDETVAMRVRANLVRDPLTDASTIDVDVDDGLARLTGEVGTYWEKMRVDDLAARARGVKSVGNDVEVRDGYKPLIHDPYVDDVDWMAATWYHPTPAPTPMGDEKLRRAVENEIFWSPFVDLQDVTVTIDDGVVDLSGRVDSWMEQHAAIMNAYEAGASWVKDDLSIKPSDAAKADGQEAPAGDGGA